MTTRKMGEAICSKDEDELYFIGVIDTLAPYDIARAAQDTCQSIAGFLTGYRGTTHSIVEPIMFGQRQLLLFREVCGEASSSSLPAAQRYEGSRAELRRRFLFFGLTAVLAFAIGSISRRRRDGNSY